MSERLLRDTSCGRRADRGFAVIAALFLVIAAGVLGAAVAVMSMAQQKEESLDFLGVLAFNAARDGIDYGTYQAIVGDGASTRCTSTDANNPTVWTFTPTQWQGRITLRIECHKHALDDGGTLVMYALTSTACNRTSCPGTVDETYVERQVRTWVEGPGS